MTMMKCICLLLIILAFVATNELNQVFVEDDIIEFGMNIVRWTLLRSQYRASVPQSLTLLMNFKHDGTTSFEIIQGSQTIFSDYGFCKYGQLFDPSTGRCRDIYCQDINHKFNGTTCIPDDNKNTINSYKRMSDIDFSITLTISPTNRNRTEEFSQRLNSQMNATCTSNFSKMFHNAIHGYLNIDYERITKIKFEITDLQALSTNGLKASNLISVKGNNTQVIYPNSQISDFICQKLLNNESIMTNFYFSLTDRNETSSDTMTGFHVITLLFLASDQHVIIDLCKNYSMQIDRVSIISDKNKTQQDFCSDPDTMQTSKNGVMHRRIKPDGGIDYVVYIPEWSTTYEIGDYSYIFMVSTSRTQQAQTADAFHTWSTKVVSVCNRQPRIVDRCPDSLVMRIALCEVTQYQNRSVRIKRTGRLYTNRQYRYDDFRPDLYIVVCKHDAHNTTTNATKLGFFDKAPGFVSTIAIFLSICALSITLITFMLFSVLRNLPGCNLMNLIISLMVAEILFLLQSLLIMTRPSVCLLLALGIHFFFLASFFWMNVMAFDLWKTFHKGFSIYACEIRERLPYYALYAWGMPILIVAIGVLLDINNASLKPCYGRYFRGCYDVCFHTKYDIPLQGCWIESALMRLILFGIPIAIILIINFVLYALTVRNIRQALKSVRLAISYKFLHKKLVRPGEHDVKIYMRMAVLAGFGWTIGFILLLLPDGQQGFQYYLSTVFKYLFILLNATPGLFIFVVYVCNRRVLSLYSDLFVNLFQIIHLKYELSKIWIVNQVQINFNRIKHRFNRKQKQDPPAKT